MWWRIAWPKTRSKLSSANGSASASVADRRRPRARARRRSRESVASIPGEMSVAVARSISPELQQVEREVAGAGADLERVAERARRLARRAPWRSFAPHLGLADLAEVDPPLGVVLAGGGVVVAGVGVLDLARRSPSGRRASARDSRCYRRQSLRSAPWKRPICSRTSPPGVPPLALTGERTLPDVPEENYWFRRHLAVYEWIAERVAGQRSPTSPAARATAPTCSPRRAAEVVGVDANPEAHEHARLRYRRPEPALRAHPGRDASTSRCDAIVFLQTIEHVDDPGALLARFARARAGRLRLDPEPAHARPRGRREVRQPVAPARVHGRRVPRAARAALRVGRAARPLSRRQAARSTSSR